MLVRHVADRTVFSYTAAMMLAAPRRSPLRALLLAALALAACGGAAKPAVGGSQMVLLPPRPADCELELVTVTAAEMMPGARFGAGGKYQMIGVVSLGLEQGTDVMSPAVKALVRTKACGYGGVVVSLMATGDTSHLQIGGNTIRTVAQTDVVFTVWGPVGTAADAPRRF